MLISILSLLKNVDEPLAIYVMTLKPHTVAKDYLPVSDEAAAFLNAHVQSANPASFVQNIDATATQAA